MEWISIKDRMPEIDGDYLCFAICPKSKVSLIYQRPYMIKFGFIPIEHHKMISHWMPLPEEPKD